jgi:hypothetical protein
VFQEKRAGKLECGFFGSRGKENGVMASCLKPSGTLLGGWIFGIWVIVQDE